MFSIRQLVFGILLFPVAGQAALLEQGFRTEYDISRNDFHIGVAERRLTPQPTGILIFESIAKPEGLAALFVRDRIIERSHISPYSQGLRPLLYEYQQKGGSKDKHYRLEFNWPKGTLHNTNIDETLSLSEDTQDLLSFQLVLMQTLQRGKRELAFHLADRNKVRPYTLKYQGEMKLWTTLGELKVIKLEHRRKDRNDVYTFWCAPGLEYLPVQVQRIEDDGDRILLKLRHFGSLPNNNATANK